MCCGKSDTSIDTALLACRFSEQQQHRMAAVSAELDALKQHQAELHMSAAELGAAARMEAAEQQLAGLQQVLQQADAEHAAKVEQILQQLAQVCVHGGDVSCQCLPLALEIVAVPRLNLHVCLEYIATVRWPEMCFLPCHACRTSAPMTES